jgi:hypothetical protein
MEQIASIKSQLNEGLRSAEPGSGTYVYYDTKSKIFDTLIASILRDAAPNPNELEFYDLSYKLKALKDKGKSDDHMEKRVNELRSIVVKEPTTRLFS